MKSLLLRINASLNSTRTGLTVFTAFGLLTTAMIGFAELPIARPNDPFTTPPPVQTLGPGEIKLSGRLSQTRLVQGGDGVIYLNLDIEAPPSPAGIGPRAATDLIVVLDRSGSMAAENRLPFAKQAVADLLHRLTPEDRFALVAFDSTASVLTDLAAVTPAERERLTSVVNLVQPGSGTNMSEALFQARALALRGGSDRRRKLLLLSDGQANEGITDPAGLGALARGLNENGAIVSTIGMGLGFNEMLMAALADHGMGSLRLSRGSRGPGRDPSAKPERLAEYLCTRQRDRDRAFAGGHTRRRRRLSGVAGSTGRRAAAYRADPERRQTPLDPDLQHAHGKQQGILIGIASAALPDRYSARGGAAWERATHARRPA